MRFAALLWLLIAGYLAITAALLAEPVRFVAAGTFAIANAVLEGILADHP